MRAEHVYISSTQMRQADAHGNGKIKSKSKTTQNKNTSKTTTKMHIRRLCIDAGVNACRLLTRHFICLFIFFSSFHCIYVLTYVHMCTYNIHKHSYIFILALIFM